MLYKGFQLDMMTMSEMEKRKGKKYICCQIGKLLVRNSKECCPGKPTSTRRAPGGIASETFGRAKKKKVVF